MEAFLQGIPITTHAEQTAVEQFRQRLEYLSVPAKTMLLREGEVAQKMYLVRKGCLRLYFYNAGNDITFQFFFEGEHGSVFRQLAQAAAEPILVGEY